MIEPQIYSPDRVCGFVPAKHLKGKHISDFFADWSGRTVDIRQEARIAEEQTLLALIDDAQKHFPQNPQQHPLWRLIGEHAVSIASAACEVRSLASHLAFVPVGRALVDLSNAAAKHAATCSGLDTETRADIVVGISRFGLHVAQHFHENAPFQKSCFCKQQWDFFMNRYSNCGAAGTVDAGVREYEKAIRWRACPQILIFASDFALITAKATPERGADPEFAADLRKAYGKFARTVRSSLETACRLS